VVRAAGPLLFWRGSWFNVSMTIPQARELKYGALVQPISFFEADPSTWQKPAKTREVRLICLHSAEIAEVANAAEALQQWAAGKGHPIHASWHFAVDCDSVSQSVNLDNVAWHAGPINGYSIGIEQAGKAAQTREQWLDDYSRKELELVSKMVAMLCGIYKLPIEHISDPSLPNVRGVTTHYDVTHSWKVKGGHTDPGPNYPIDMVLARAREILATACV